MLRWGLSICNIFCTKIGQFRPKMSKFGPGPELDISYLISHIFNTVFYNKTFIEHNLKILDQFSKPLDFCQIPAILYIQTS